jgi:hypothetical protein
MRSRVSLDWLTPRRGLITIFRKPIRIVVSGETVSGNGRGRPPVFSDETLRRAAGYSYARHVSTRRGAQDLVYRMFAIAVIEHYCEAYPEHSATFAWLLTPRRRHALLTELGRLAQPRSGDDGSLRWSEAHVERLIRAAFEVSEAKPNTKAGVAMVRRHRKQ